VLDPPTPADREALSAFAARHELEIYLQGGGLDSVQALTPPATALSYSLAREDVRVGFLPTDSSR